MVHPAPVSEDVSPIEANLDRMYWSSLLNGHMMPGLGLAASRVHTPNERPIKISEGSTRSQRTRINASAETDRR
jgi:hypothetical protein